MNDKTTLSARPRKPGVECFKFSTYENPCTLKNKANRTSWAMQNDPFDEFSRKRKLCVLCELCERSKKMFGPSFRMGNYLVTNTKKSQNR